MLQQYAQIYYGWFCCRNTEDDDENYRKLNGISIDFDTNECIRVKQIRIYNIYI